MKTPREEKKTQNNRNFCIELLINSERAVCKIIYMQSWMCAGGL